MEQLSVRLTDWMFAQLDGLAAERGITRTRAVRQLLEAGLRDRPVRVPDSTIARLDAVAAEQGVARTRVIRQLLDAGLGDRPGPPAGALSERQLIALLTERARAGNVSAIRSLLLREEAKDPQSRAMALFAAMAEERRQ